MWDNTFDFKKLKIYVYLHHIGMFDIRLCPTKKNPNVAE